MQPSAELRCIVSARDGDETDHSAQSNRVARNTAIGHTNLPSLGVWQPKPPNRREAQFWDAQISVHGQTKHHNTPQSITHHIREEKAANLPSWPRSSRTQRISTAFDAISARVLMSQQSPCSLLVLLLIGLLTVETGTQLLLHLLRLGGGPWSYVKSSFVLSSLVHASDSREDNLLRSQASPSASPLCPCPCTTDNEVRTRRHSLHGQLFLHL